jgi:hypothetical protein
MTDTILTADERACLRTWFRQALVKVECEEARRNIAAFYDEPEKTREGHYIPVARRARRAPQVMTRELV